MTLWLSITSFAGILSEIYQGLIMEQHTLKNVDNCLNTNIYSCLEASGGQSFNLYLNVVPFLTPVLIRHLWQLKTVVFLHWCLMCAVQLITFIPWIIWCYTQNLLQ
jgi:hypothetical protein